MAFTSEAAGLLAAADNLCVFAHEGQTRKYTGEPYHEHPRAVAELVAASGGSPEMQAAALLHDVLEDTEITADLIEGVCGTRVRELVEELTEGSFDGNRAERKAQERERLSRVSPEAQFIKVCDMIDNTRSISVHDPSFWKVYRKEKQQLLAEFRSTEQATPGLTDAFRALMSQAMVQTLA